MASAYMHPLFKTKWGWRRKMRKRGSFCFVCVCACTCMCVCVCFILNQWRNRVGSMAAYRKAAKKGARLWHTREPPSLDFSLLFAALNSRGPPSIPALPRLQHDHIWRIYPIKTFFFYLPEKKMIQEIGSHKLPKHIRVTTMWCHCHSR